MEIIQQESSVFQFMQFSDKTIRLTAYVMFHGTRKVRKHLYPFFKVLSSIYLCLEVEMCELGAQTDTYFVGGRGEKKIFHQT